MIRIIWLLKERMGHTRLILMKKNRHRLGFYLFIQNSINRILKLKTKLNIMEWEKAQEMTIWFNLPT